MGIEAVMGARLAGAAGVAALVGMKVSWGPAHQDTSPPYLTYRFRTEPMMTVQGPVGPLTTTMLVRCWAKTPEGALELEAAARAALEGYVDPAASPRVMATNWRSSEDAFDEAMDLNGRDVAFSVKHGDA